MKNIYDTAINFGGFYNTIHDTQVDIMVANELDTFVDSEIDDEIDYDHKAYNNFNEYGRFQIAYSKEWVSLFNDKFGTKLVFKSVDSPKEYNFRTDKIIVDVANSDVKVLINYINDCDLKEVLFEAIKENTTSRDGYVAFYTYREYFLKENRHFLIETIIDVVLENEFYDYALYVEDIYSI